MHIQVDSINCVARLYDLVNDSPNELNIGAADDGRVTLGIEDRDAGDAGHWITVTRDELLAALAVVALPRLSVEAPTRSEWVAPVAADAA